MNRNWLQEYIHPVKFVAPGGKPVVQVEAEMSGETVRVWVTDNGRGIPGEASEKIFGMFQRLHHEKRYPGTGSGLAIVRKAVPRWAARWDWNRNWAPAAGFGSS